MEGETRKDERKRKGFGKRETGESREGIRVLNPKGGEKKILVSLGGLKPEGGVKKGGGNQKSRTRRGKEREEGWPNGLVRTGRRREFWETVFRKGIKRRRDIGFGQAGKWFGQDRTSNFFPSWIRKEVDRIRAEGRLGCKIGLVAYKSSEGEQISIYPGE